jgi:hypothetical protein
MNQTERGDEMVDDREAAAIADQRADDRAVLAWLQAAAAAPGKALHLALLLAGQCRRQGSAHVHLTRPMLAQAGLSRDACYDGLRRLETLGLVAVQRVPGHSPHVRLVLGSMGQGTG